MKMFRILMFVFLCIFLLKPVQVEAKLEAPKNPIAICKNSHSIKLKWNKCNDADGYKIYRYSDSKKRFIKVKNINKNISKWTDKSLKKHKVYYYKIASYQKGKNKNKNSKKTYKICARTYGENGKIVNALSVYTELNTGKSIGICSEGKIKATVLGSTNTKQNRTKVVSKKIIWSSSDKTIATVGKKGVVKTYDKEGTCYIKMRLHNGKTKKVKLRVVNYANPQNFKYYNGNISSINNLLKNYRDNLCDVATFFTVYGKDGKSGKISVDGTGKIIYSSDINNIERIEDSVKRLMEEYPLPMDISYVGKGYVEFKIYFENSYYIITYSEENDFSTSPLKLADHWIGKTYIFGEH